MSAFKKPRSKVIAIRPYSAKEVVASLSKTLSHDSIGDDLSDADDLSDTIAIDFTVTKSAKAGVLEFVATLSNLDKGTEVVSLSGELKAPKLYNKNLYAYVSSGAVKEDANYDLFNLHALSYKTVEK